MNTFDLAMDARQKHKINSTLALIYFVFKLIWLSCALTTSNGWKAAEANIAIPKF